MKIRKLHLKNIGVFDNEEIIFQPCKAKDKAEIHIFTGQNGSGKSTILMALAGGFGRSEPFDIEHQSYKLSKRFKNFDDGYGMSEILITLDDGEVIKAIASHITPEIRNIGIASVSERVESYRRLFAYDQLPNFVFEFAVFAYSGYRQINSEPVEAIKEPAKSNPLEQSLNFVKVFNEERELTTNQLIANNISKKWIESSRNPEKSAKFASVLSSIEEAVSDITGWRIEFDLETEPTNLIVRVNGDKLDFDVLPDGLRSLISWIADLAGRVDLLKWQDDLPTFEKNLILFLDEIEVHLHPAWQRKVLPVVQKLFKNSQIFISTHSPFVINSVDDAWVYKLELENGKARVADVVKSEDGYSYRYVLRSILGITEQFGVEVQKDLDRFYDLRNKVLENGSKSTEKDLLKLAKTLAKQSEELNRIVQAELRQISGLKGKEFSL